MFADQTVVQITGRIQETMKDHQDLRLKLSELSEEPGRQLKFIQRLRAFHRVQAEDAKAGLLNEPEHSESEIEEVRRRWNLLKDRWIESRLGKVEKE